MAKCRSCKGHGYIVFMGDSVDDLWQEPCAHCNGTGRDDYLEWFAKQVQGALSECKREQEADDE